MKWKKLGQIILPDAKVCWMATYVGPTFVRVIEDEIWLYVSGRDSQNQSRVGIVRATLRGEEFQILAVSREPVMELGELGTFDESGVSYPWLIEADGDLLMYYVGWVAGGKNRFMNFTGLARSKDNGLSFSRVSRVPILDRTDGEPFGTGSCCVFRSSDQWYMYYTSFDRWDPVPGKNRPCYNIKLAVSTDGMSWSRPGRIVIGYKDSEEYVISKPMLIREDGLFRLWYCSRGEDYRIGYAESVDGLQFQRLDDEVGITVSTEGWDSQMVEYAFIFDFGGQRYMVYNGNQFGKTGLGLAVLEA